MIIKLFFFSQREKKSQREKIVLFDYVGTDNAFLYSHHLSFTYASLVPTPPPPPIHRVKEITRWTIMKFESNKHKTCFWTLYENNKHAEKKQQKNKKKKQKNMHLNVAVELWWW